MTKCERLREQYVSYVLGLLEAEERAVISSHLSSGCPACQREVATILQLVSQLAYPHSLEAPAELRDRVLAVLARRRLI